MENCKCFLCRTKGHPFRSVYRGRAAAKIDTFLRCGKVYRTHNSARLEGSGEVALIAGAINSTPPQPASLVAFLPEQESYPPEEPHLQIRKKVSFSTHKAPPNDIDFFDTLKHPEYLRIPDVCYVVFTGFPGRTSPRWLHWPPRCRLPH